MPADSCRRFATQQRSQTLSSLLNGPSQMCFEAIKALKERNGSSIQAIKKHITSSHPTLNFTPHQMRSALKKGTESGKFVKVRGQHEHNSGASFPWPLAAAW